MTLKDLENYVLLTEQRIEDKIKTRSRNWLIAAGVFIVLIAILFFTVFRRHPEVDQSYLNELAAKDSVLKYQQQKIDALQMVNDSQDSLIKMLDEKYKGNRPAETRIINHYERIPIDINALDREQLRREVSKY